MVLAKIAERTLQTYELSGWTDETAKPKPNGRAMPRIPTAPGGPIIVCLDTSWSMEGPREELAKSVVVEAVRIAHQQHRAVRPFRQSMTQ